ncbi:MAG: hypothetical protein CMH49_06530 [Myxococcales bacterium]|nr:hypothetical protein [Myxococcales bacterium]
MRKIPNKYVTLASQILCIVFFLQFTQLTQAQKLVQIQRVMNDKELRTLSTLLSKSEVLIERKAIAKKAYHFAKPRQEQGKGISLSSQLFLTSSAWLKIRPDESDINLNLSCPYASTHDQSTWQAPQLRFEAKLIAMSHSQGWALLKSKHQTQCVGTDVSRLSKSYLEQSFYIGRRLYLYEPKPLLPAQLSILGQATTPMHYYWYSTGYLMSGSALYNHEGLLISLSAMPDLSSPEAKTFILPPSAIAEALVKAKAILQQP